MGHRCSIHCLIPPIVLDRIATNGNAQQREWAVETLKHDHTIRTARLQNALIAAGGPREGPDALAKGVAGRLNRRIYDAKHTDDVPPPGPPVRREGDPATGDAAVDEAYDGLGDTHSFYWDVLGRDSIDDEGMPLRGIVHFSQDYDNAFWDGRRMIFGDGDGELFVRFTKSLDVIGHELTHGVTEDEAALEYFGQSGALNEHVSDVFGSLVKQYTLGQDATTAEWLIGAEILAPGVRGKALRSMQAPGTAFDDPVLGKDPQPAHWRDYVRTTDDNGGVHINSGIPNHAFYVTAMEIGGNAWEAPGEIWYETLRHPSLRPTATFRRFARLTFVTAERLYGQGSDEATAVKKGWDTVGVRWAPTAQPDLVPA